MTRIRTGVAVLALWLLAAAPAAGGTALQSRGHALEITEKLYLNHKALKDAYQDIRLIAMGYLNAPDSKLNNIQRIYIFVDEADTIGRHQWELLSLMEAVCRERQADYFTLRVKGLKRAVDKSRDRTDLIRLYRAYLEKETALEAVDAALALIAGNIYLFEQLIEVLEPLGNPPRSW